VEKLNHFVCECGAEIFFNDIDKLVVREWIKYHKPHMKKYLKCRSLKEAYKLMERKKARKEENE